MKYEFGKGNTVLKFKITDDGMVSSNGFFGKTTDESRFYPIADVVLCGERNDGQGAKHTGTYGSRELKYKDHSYNEKNGLLDFILESDKIEVTVHYRLYDDISAVRSWTTVKNIFSEDIGIEYVSSLCYYGIDLNSTLIIPHNSWMREMNFKEFSLEELGLTTVSTTKRFSVSNTGTWSSKEFLPMAICKSDSDAIIWQIENNGSWQWEISDMSGLLYLKLSGPTEQENDWYKELAPGESFDSVKVCISHGKDTDEALSGMTGYRRKIFYNNEANQKLPVIFNDYMHCIGANPTVEKMIPVIDKAAEAGAEYYCMDAGWYAGIDTGWWDSVGEWKQENKRFPNGIKAVFDYIRKKGMIPGIWLEIEVMGVRCPILDQFDDTCFFMRHGKRVIKGGRYQLDFRNKKVRDFASDVIRRVVSEYGAGYIKFDYNIDGGVGTEINSDSFGDGLLEHNRAYIAWIEEIKKEYPELIIENCGSGGMRIDYAMLKSFHLQSVTDQEKYINTAYIAAGAPTAILPEQAAIWAYPIAAENTNAAAFNLANAVLMRIHLSGELTKLSDEQFSVVCEGVRVYKNLRNDISDMVPFYPIGIPHYGDGFLCLGMKNESCKRLVLWRINTEKDELEIPVSGDGRLIYPSDTKVSIQSGSKLLVKMPEKFTAVIIEMN